MESSPNKKRGEEISKKKKKRKVGGGGSSRAKTVVKASSQDPSTHSPSLRPETTTINEKIEISLKRTERPGAAVGLY